MTRRELQKKVFERDNYICVYCKRDTRQHGGATLDHVIPLVRGGDWSMANLATACFDCNGKKGCLTLDEFQPSTLKVSIQERIGKR